MKSAMIRSGKHRCMFFASAWWDFTGLVVGLRRLITVHTSEGLGQQGIGQLPCYLKTLCKIFSGGDVTRKGPSQTNDGVVFDRAQTDFWFSMYCFMMACGVPPTVETKYAFVHKVGKRLLSLGNS